MSDVYIAGSLKHVPKEWWKIYEKISGVVTKFGLKSYVPHLDTINGLNLKVEDIQNPHLDFSSRAKIFKRDIEVIKNSKLIIAEITNPSTGTGVEIGFALKLKKPIICLAHKDVDITNMVLGPVHMGLIKFIRYENEKDVLIKLEDMLMELKF
jgi:nucleoside 2-deoxyribosyltransferase